MFADASALTAILAREPGADELIVRLEQTRSKVTSPMAVWETSVAMARILGLTPRTACSDVLEYLSVAGIELKEVPAATAMSAIDAFERYGKGRHKAGLNFGDCFAYACARHFHMPLLYKGSDFALTDIEAA
jgi:ribonuclease VapC